MEKVMLTRKDLVLAAVAGLALLVLCFGFGYFFGGYGQVQKNRALLEVVPEVNCGIKFQMTNPKQQINYNYQ